MHCRVAENKLPDRTVRFSKIENVIVGQIPLAVAGPVKDRDRPVGQRSHDSTFNMTRTKRRSFKKILNTIVLNIKHLNTISGVCILIFGLFYLLGLTFPL